MNNSYNKKNCIVTGGAGFIGQMLVNKLVQAGANVYVIDNFSFGAKKENINHKAKVIEGDIRDLQVFEKIPKIDFKYFFHFAAPSSIILFNRDYMNSVDITINGFLNVAQFCLEKQIRLVFPSTGNLYSGTPIPQSEKAAIDFSNINSYSGAKLSLELIQKSLVNLDSLGLRIFAAYGPQEKHKGDFASIIYLFSKSMAKGKSPVIFGDGNQRRDFIYIDDVADAILSLTPTCKDKIINVGSGKNYSFNETINIINKYLGEKVYPKYIAKPNLYLEETLSDNTLLEKYYTVKTPLEQGIKNVLESFREK